MAGEHIMHHTDGFWNGIWSDLFIQSPLRARSFQDNRYNSERDNPRRVGSVTMGHMSNDVAGLDNNQDHVVMRHKEERPIRIYDDSRDRQSIRESIAWSIDLFDVD